MEVRFGVWLPWRAGMEKQQADAYAVPILGWYSNSDSNIIRITDSLEDVEPMIVKMRRQILRKCGFVSSYRQLWEYNDLGLVGNG